AQLREAITGGGITMLRKDSFDTPNGLLEVASAATKGDVLADILVHELSGDYVIRLGDRIVDPNVGLRLDPPGHAAISPKDTQLDGMSTGRRESEAHCAPKDIG